MKINSFTLLGNIFKVIRIVILAILIVASVTCIFLFFGEINFRENNQMVGNPDQAGLRAGFKYLVFISFFILGTISGIFSVSDYMIFKKNTGLINIFLSLLIVLISLIS